MKNTAKQQRDTRQRRLVYDTVMHRKDHPDADAIYEEIRGIDPKVSKATVYRNLRLLAEKREITHVRVPGADRFDSTLCNHYHIYCTVCGGVFDAPIPYITENDATVETVTGFRITRHRTIFEGVCPSCAARAESKKEI